MNVGRNIWGYNIFQVESCEYFDDCGVCEGNNDCLISLDPDHGMQGSDDLLVTLVANELNFYDEIKCIVIDKDNY